MNAKCSTCDMLLTRINIDPVPGQLGGAEIRCITFACPMCRTIVGAQVDPWALKTETVAEVRKLLKGR